MPSCVPQFRLRSNACGIASRCSMHSRIRRKKVKTAIIAGRFYMKNKSLMFKIFINTFFVGTLIYFICAFLFISNMYGYFENQIFSELQTESSFLEPAVLEGNINQISTPWCKKTRFSKNFPVFFHNDRKNTLFCPSSFKW